MEEQELPEIKSTTPVQKSVTVLSIIEELKKSNGFLIFTAFVVKGEEGSDPHLEFRYMRNQYSSDDIPSAFKEIKTMLSNDLKKSGDEVLKAAEQILANEDLKGSSDIQF